MSKAEFAPWHGVFETLRVIDGVPLFPAAHRQELERAMSVLGLETSFDFEKARAGLPRLSGRWRWIVTREGTRTEFTEEEVVQPEPVTVSVSPVRVGSFNWDARFKTLSHLTHAQAWQIKLTSEVILLNELGNIASAARSNIFWKIRGKLFTPTHESGCRRGVVRGFITQRHAVKSGHFPFTDLLNAEEIFLTNSLKGIVPVKMVAERSYAKSSTARELCAEYEAEIARQLAAGRP